MPDLLLFHNQGRGRPIGGGGVTPAIACFTVGTSKVGTDKICEGTYAQKVIDQAPNELIAYWIQGESSGAVADNAEGTAARDGAYTGVTLGQTGIGDGNTCPLFDGTNDNLDIQTASLTSAFDGTVGTLAIWVKVESAAVWEDGTARRMFHLQGENTNNRIYIQRETTSNRVSWRFVAGSVSDAVVKNGVSTTEWMHFALTWTDSGDEVKAYYNGTQEGATATGIGTWNAIPNLVESDIGSDNGSSTYWKGYLAHGAIWSKVLSDAQIASLATV